VPTPPADDPSSKAGAAAPGAPTPGAGRRETFLARYPRWLKIAVALGALFLVTLPAYLGGGKPASAPAAQASFPVRFGSGEATTSAPASKPAAPTFQSGVNAADGRALDAAEESKKVPMAVAPEADVTEQTAKGALPRISDAGRQPWQVYARPFDLADKRPRVAIVISGLGFAPIASASAIDRLPPNVTLAFDVESPVVASWCGRARQMGHETILNVPMEPFDYPRSDPGPHALLTTMPDAGNLKRLDWALGQCSGYAGITTLSGSRFTTDPGKLMPMLDELHKRGLLLLDARAAPRSTLFGLAKEAHVPAATITMRIDADLSPAAIDTALQQLEQTARLSGSAVGLASATPVVIDRLKLWIKQLPQDGIALAPLSAVVQ